MDGDSRGRTLSEDRAESGHQLVMRPANTVRGRTDHVTLSVSDVSEEADGAAMRQTADEPLLHVLQQLLQTEALHKTKEVSSGVQPPDTQNEPHSPKTGKGMACLVWRDSL